MVLDPLSAISLASTVIQFVDFGTKLISKGREYYESADGVLTEHAEHAAISDRLSDLTKRLSEYISSTSSNRKLSHAEEALQEITDECRVIAEEFAITLDKLRIVGTKRKWKSIRQAFQSVWQKDEIERQLIRLDRLRQQVIIQLLVVINDGQIKAFRKIDLDIQSMDGKIQNVIRMENDSTREQILELNKTMSKLVREQARDVRTDLMTKGEARMQLIEGWRAQNEAQLTAILDKVSQMDVSQKENQYKRKVLDSLYFETINDRHDMIDKSFETTLKWVYNPPDGIHAKWSSFSTWLQYGNGLYWVAGKAGSGKSTLMKYLYHEQRTEALLKDWSEDKPLLLARYFFWISGKSEAQKSLSGLLRSILYDLLQECPAVVMSISNSRWRCHDLNLTHFPAWTNEDLVSAIQIFVRKTADQARICLFIDGLDEFDGKDHQRLEVIGLLKSLSQSSNLKICVSSRPWEIFKDSFSACPKLQLELLTEQDIKNYVDDTFDANEMFQALRSRDAEFCSRLVTELTGKAKGVWLWVILVTRSLLEGLRYQDSAADLLARLRAIPEELEDYFLQMFNRIDSFYKPKALKMFKVTLFHVQLSLMSLSFLDEEEENFAFSTPAKWTSEAVIQDRIVLAATRLNARCLGLLEVVNSQHYGGLMVDFLHRTAHDFVASPDTQKLIGMNQIDAFDVALFHCQSLLAQIKMMSVSLTRPPPLNATMLLFMTVARELEEDDSAYIIPLLAHMDEVLAGKDWGSVRVPNPRYVVEAWSFEPEDEVPLLPLCIQFGLTRYVKQVLGTNARIAKMPRYRPLLDLALRRYVSTENFDMRELGEIGIVGVGAIMPDPELVQVLLEQGADPNERMGFSTIWRSYLGRLDKIVDDLNKKEVPLNIIQPWIDAAELCIRYGATRVLESSISVPSQPSSRTRIRTSKRELLAKTTLAAAFGDEEANRLDSLSWQLSITGINLVTNLNRSVRSFFG